METGTFLHVYISNSLSLTLLFEIWAALKTYKDIPHTFVYIFSFFLLADVSLSLCCA